MAEPPVLDFEQLAAVMGSTSLDDQKEALLLFVRMFAPVPGRMAKALEAREARQVREIAHAAKGTAATAGARRLSEFMSSIEIAAKAADWNKIDRMAATVEVYFDEVRSAVNAL